MSEPLLRYPGPCRVGRLLRREKRFFLFVELDGREVAAHTNNTGTMLGLLRPGSPVLLSPATNPGRRLAWTVEALGLPRGGDFFWVGVNTLMPNRLLSALSGAGLLPWAAGYATLRREAVYGESRLDGVFRGEGLPDLWVECKNVTMVEDGVACFPDAATERGQKHLRELMDIVRCGERAAMFYLVQRPDGHCFGPADVVDPAYAALFYEAMDAGVEIYPYRASVSPAGIELEGLLPVAPRPAGL